MPRQTRHPSQRNDESSNVMPAARKTKAGMNNDPKTQNMEATPTMLRTREEGTPEQEEVLGSSISGTAPVPGGVASGQLVRTYAMQILAPFIRQEVLNKHPVPSNFLRDIWWALSSDSYPRLTRDMGFVSAREIREAGEILEPPDSPACMQEGAIFHFLIKLSGRGRNCNCGSWIHSNPSTNSSCARMRFLNEHNIKKE